MNPTDCYKLLALSDGSSHQEVKAARRKLLMEWHPDKVAHNSALQAIALEHSKQINMAADFLLAQQPFASPSPSDRQQTNTNTNDHSRATEENKRQSERDQRQANEEAKQRQRREAEERRQQEAAEESNRRQQQEARAAQRAEELRQREATKKEKAKRSRFWWATFLVVMLLYRYTVLQAHQTPKVIPQQVYDTPREATPAATTPVQQTYVSSQWMSIRSDWLKSDYGRSILGYSASQVHQLLGTPTATLNHSNTIQDDLWFPGTSDNPEYLGTSNANPIFVSVVYKEDKVVQVENNISLSDETPPVSVDIPTLHRVIDTHPYLHLSVIYYADNPHADTAIGDNRREEATHFLDMGGVSYYDDVAGGIAYLFDRGRFHSDDIARLQPVTSTDAEADRIIVHTPGVNVIPAGDGEKEQKKDFPDMHNTSSN